VLLGYKHRHLIPSALVGGGGGVARVLIPKGKKHLKKKIGLSYKIPITKTFSGI
jgi:hypothetical protein